jgi:hypothetical protein
VKIKLYSLQSEKAHRQMLLLTELTSNQDKSNNNKN